MSKLNIRPARGRIIPPPHAPGLKVFTQWEAGFFEPRGGVADGNEIYRYLTREFSGVMGRPGVTYFFDGGFYLPHLDEVSQIVATSDVGRMGYITEKFDCEDFAMGLRGEFGLFAYNEEKLYYGFSVGLIMGEVTWINGTHAACFVVDSTGKIHLIEPRIKGVSEGVGSDALPESRLLPATECKRCDLLLI